MTWTARRRPTAVDCVVAAALTLFSQAEIWAPRLVPGVGEVTGSAPLLAVTALAMTVPIAFRRTAPLAVLVVVFGAAALQGWLTQPIEGLSALAAMLIAAYSSSAYTGPSKAVVGAVTLLVGIALVGLAVGDVAFMAIVFGSAWLMGFVVNQRSGQAARNWPGTTATCRSVCLRQRSCSQRRSGVGSVELPSSPRTTWQP